MTQERLSKTYASYQKTTDVTPSGQKTNVVGQKALDDLPVGILQNGDGTRRFLVPLLHRMC